VQAAVLRVDEEFRAAKLANDVRAMANILSEDFFETNQNGNTRDKALHLCALRARDRPCQGWAGGARQHQLRSRVRSAPVVQSLLL